MRVLLKSIKPKVLYSVAYLYKHQLTPFHLYWKLVLPSLAFVHNRNRRNLLRYRLHRRVDNIRVSQSVKCNTSTAHLRHIGLNFHARAFDIFLAGKKQRNYSSPATQINRSIFYATSNEVSQFHRVATKTKGGRILNNL